jgi:Mg2+-importing ATPase
MIEFGALSSLFDLLTFAALLVVFTANVALFRTGWFVESLTTELVIALVVRTRRPFFRSRPGTLLLASTILMLALTLALPYIPAAGLLGFAPLPLPVVGTLMAIAVLYVAATEIAKVRFFARGW